MRPGPDGNRLLRCAVALVRTEGPEVVVGFRGPTAGLSRDAGRVYPKISASGIVSPGSTAVQANVRGGAEPRDSRLPSAGIVMAGRAGPATLSTRRMRWLRRCKSVPDTGSSVSARFAEG